MENQEVYITQQQAAPLYADGVSVIGELEAKAMADAENEALVEEIEARLASGEIVAQGA